MDQDYHNAEIKAQEWAANQSFSPEARQEIQQLLSQKSEREILERFYKDLEFGTGGMRSIMGMGTNRINRYTLGKATQAICNTLKELTNNGPHPQINFPANGSPLKAVVCFDSRNHSQQFAQHVCEVFAANGVEAWIFPRLHPVPILSYALRHLKAHIGVMITASHNPIEYNGYKVYGPDGAQIISPLDEMIINCYRQLDFSQVASTEGIESGSHPLLKTVPEEVLDGYYKAISTQSLQPQLCQQQGHNLKIVYTPIHGTGLEPVTRVLKEMGSFQLSIVEAQAQPDGQFPTVKSPNPEDPAALTLACQQMLEERAHLAIGTDPDSDRLGVVINVDGEAKFLNGNQVAILLLDYVLGQKAQNNTIRPESLVIKSIVTSPLQEILCQHYGVKLEKTLTGFKWMCGLIGELERKKQPLDFVFASEESYGYLTHPHCRDKDAVAAIAMLGEVALHHQQRGKNLLGALEEIHQRHGLYLESLISFDFFGKSGAEKMQQIMKDFRTQTPKEMAGVPIVAVEDYLTQKKITSEGEQPLLLPSSNVLGLIFANGDQVYLRPSGTEPKIKFYFQVHELNYSKKAQQMAQEKLSKLEAEFSKRCSQ